jgi:hypothetical protein
MEMRAKWAGRLCLFGLIILGLSIGVTMLAYYLAGGGETGVEYVVMTGIGYLVLIGVWVGVPLTLLGCIAWIVLKVEQHKIQRLK